MIVDALHRDGTEHEAPVARIGRYEIRALIGRDATGVTYRAHDPHLAREVVLKVIGASSRAEASADAHARPLREAQRLAQLSHPNVVTTFDVGTHEGAVFLVRELVQGATLPEWLSQQRSRAEILRVLIAAGRGLAAAHAAGIEHGDFKPASVIVAADGHARVIDFGLALLTDPAASASSDQFSYGAMAFMALAGREPHPLAHEARGANERGSARAWPRSVPYRLRRVIDRSMAQRASDRYPSLGVMVSHLERAATPGLARAVGWGLLTAAFIGLALVGVRSSLGIAQPHCKLDDSAFHGIWDLDRRATVEQAFRATGRGNATEAFQLLAGRLDVFEKEWTGIRESSCEATQVRRQQSEQVFALRNACLERALSGLKALVGALGQVDASSLDRVAGALPPPLAPCSDVDALTGAAPLPADPRVRNQIEEVERENAATRALSTAGRGAESLARAEHALELARATGHAPTIAAASAQRSRAIYLAASTSEQRAAGEAAFKESIRLAADAGDDALLARTAAYLFYVIGYGEGRVEADAMLPMVEAAVQRAGNRPEQRIQLMMGQSALLAQHAKFAEQIQLLEGVLQMSETGAPELQPYAVDAAIALGRTYSALDQHDQAVRASQRAVDAVRHLYGASHPRLLFALADLARAQSTAGHLEAALAAIAEAHQLAASMRPDEPRLKYIPYAEGDVWMNSGDCARAVPFFRDAVAQFTAANGPEHTLTTDVMEELGTCLAATKQTSEAASVLERALANRRKAGNTPASTAQTEFELAKALWPLASQRARAKSLAEGARTLYSQEGADQGVRDVDEWLSARRAAELSRR